MQIYLLKDLPGKGRAGEIINVNDGYGRNFIIKNGIGKAVDNKILSQVHAKQQSAAFHNAEEIARIKAVCAKLENTEVKLMVKTGMCGKMFGSVTSAEIAAELQKLGLEIDKRNIALPEPIKAAGTYKIKVRFSFGIEGGFQLVITGTEK